MREYKAGIAQARPGAHPVEDRDGCVEDQVPPRGGGLGFQYFLGSHSHVLIFIELLLTGFS